MSKTRIQVIEQALHNLIVIAEGQSISATDTQKIDLIFDGVMAEMSALDIFTVGDPGQSGPIGGDIDDAAYLSIADYLAYRAVSAFPMQSDGVASLRNIATESVDRLRAIAGAPRGRREAKFDPQVTQTNITSAAPWPNNF